MMRHLVASHATMGDRRLAPRPFNLRWQKGWRACTNMGGVD